MAYDTPTTRDFTAAFPAFAAVDAMAISFALDEADARADDSWPDADRTRGVMLYAAHVLTLDGLGSSSEAQFGSFRRLKIGSLELEKAATSTAAMGALGSTSYGQRYLALLRRLFPAVAVV